jgi:septal ring factor EnvC (AmiA/AmiB activator)
MEVIVLIATMLMSSAAQSERDIIRGDLADTQVEVIMNQQETDQLHKYIVQVDREVGDINKELDELEATLLSIAGAHASLGANNEMEHAELTQMINTLNDRIESLRAKADYLDNKIGVLHP